jgi:hypothetical protein
MGSRATARPSHINYQVMSRNIICAASLFVPPAPFSKFESGLDALLCHRTPHSAMAFCDRGKRRRQPATNFKS